MRARHPLRSAVANISSGRYYKSISEWFCLISNTLEKHGCVLSEFDYECPQVYNDEGQSKITFTDNRGQVCYIHWTWYRMPSFNWEIICYVC